MRLVTVTISEGKVAHSHSIPAPDETKEFDESKLQYDLYRAYRIANSVVGSAILTNGESDGD